MSIGRMLYVYIGSTNFNLELKVDQFEGQICLESALYECIQDEVETEEERVGKILCLFVSNSFCLRVSDRIFETRVWRAKFPNQQDVIIKYGICLIQK